MIEVAAGGGSDTASGFAQGVALEFNPIGGVNNAVQDRLHKWNPQSSQTAAVFERLITEVSITERRHSLFGQRLNVAPEASCRGPDWVTVILPDGRRRHVRRVATDLVPASTDAHPVSERGNARISVRTLLPLADCLRTLLRISREEVPDDQSRSRTSDQPSIQPATGLSDGVPDAVVGPATGCAAADRQGIRRHDGPDACGTSPRNFGDPSC